MSDATTVNQQVIDAVDNTTTRVVGQAAAQSQGLLDTVMAETLGMAMHNAVGGQHRSQMIGGAAVAATCARMLGGGPVPVVNVDSPAPPLPTSGGSSDIAANNREAKAAIGNLVQESNAAAKDQAAADDNLQKLSEQASRQPGS